MNKKIKKFRKKCSIKIIVLILINFVFVVPMLFSSNCGTTAAQILNMNTSSRIVGMGNAGIGLADDLNALVYNPAGLSQVSGTQLQFTYIFYFLGTKMSSVSYGQKIGKILPGKLSDAGFGFKWKYFYTKDTVRNEAGVEEESFAIKYSQYSIGMGFPLSNNRHSLGFAVNTVSEEIYTEKDSKVAIDLGWHYKFYAGEAEPPIPFKKSRGWYMDAIGIRKKLKKSVRINTIGAAIKNLGENKLPVKLVLGGAHELIDDIVIVWETFTSREISLGFKCGVEAEIEGFKARAGFIYTTNPNITIGFGIPEKNWNIDYAFFMHMDLGIAHRVSYGVYF